MPATPGYCAGGRGTLPGEFAGGADHGAGVPVNYVKGAVDPGIQGTLEAGVRPGPEMTAGAGGLPVAPHLHIPEQGLAQGDGRRSGPARPSGLLLLRKPVRPGGSMSCTVFRENGALGSGPMFWAAAVRAVSMEAGNTRLKEQTTTINLARRPPVCNNDIFFMRCSSLLHPGRNSGRSPGPGSSSNIDRDPCSYQNRLSTPRDTLAVGVDELHRGV